jgi:hypothetical protein
MTERDWLYAFSWGVICVGPLAFAAGAVCVLSLQERYRGISSSSSRSSAMLSASSSTWSSGIPRFSRWIWGSNSSTSARNRRARTAAMGSSGSVNMTLPGASIVPRRGQGGS